MLEFVVEKNEKVAVIIIFNCNAWTYALSFVTHLLLIPLDTAMEMSPLRSTSSQELEWDPAGAQLVSTVSGPAYLIRNVVTGLFPL